VGAAGAFGCAGWEAAPGRTLPSTAGQRICVSSTGDGLSPGTFNASADVGGTAHADPDSPFVAKARSPCALSPPSLPPSLRRDTRIARACF